MKKILLMIFLVALTVGLVYLGYIIFGAANVKEIEIVGDVQQIYFVGDDLNFGDAKLKVTYQNGTSKFIDMQGNSSINVSMFSTFGYGKYYGTMKIEYKNQVAEVDYTVIERTAYIIDSETKITSYGKTNVSQTTKKIIDFKKNGKLKYFEIISGDYFVNDGEYDSDYYYEIVGDTIFVHIGAETIYEIKAIKSGGEISVEATSKHYSNKHADIVDYVIETKFKTTNLIKTNNYKQEKTDLDIIYDKLAFTSQKENGKTVLNIPKDKTIKESGLYLKVDYDNGEVYYVYITNRMLSSTLRQDNDGETFNINGYYEGRKFTIFYKII